MFPKYPDTRAAVRRWRWGQMGWDWADWITETALRRFGGGNLGKTKRREWRLWRGSGGRKAKEQTWRQPFFFQTLVCVKDVLSSRRPHWPTAHSHQSTSREPPAPSLNQYSKDPEAYVMWSWQNNYSRNTNVPPRLIIMLLCRNITFLPLKTLQPTSSWWVS